MADQVARELPQTAPDVPRRQSGHISPYQPWGGGPAGRTCGECIHLRCHRWANAHWKCEVFTSGSTVKGGYGGKRRKRDPACHRFEERPAEDDSSG